MAGERRQTSSQEHAGDCVRTYSAVGRVSGVGLGHRGQCAGARVHEALRLSHRAEWAYSPNHAEGGRQYHVPYGDFDRLPATQAGRGAIAGADESSSGTTTQFAGSNGGELRAQASLARGDGFDAGVVVVAGTQVSAQPTGANLGHPEQRAKLERANY